MPDIGDGWEFDDEVNKDHQWDQGMLEILVQIEELANNLFAQHGLDPQEGWVALAEAALMNVRGNHHGEDD